MLTFTQDWVQKPKSIASSNLRTISLVHFTKVSTIEGALESEVLIIFTSLQKNSSWLAVIIRISTKYCHETLGVVTHERVNSRTAQVVKLREEFKVHSIHTKPNSCIIVGHQVHVFQFNDHEKSRISKLSLSITNLLSNQIQNHKTLLISKGLSFVKLTYIFHVEDKFGFTISFTQSWKVRSSGQSNIP